MDRMDSDSDSDNQDELKVYAEIMDSKDLCGFLSCIHLIMEVVDKHGGFSSFFWRELTCDGDKAGGGGGGAGGQLCATLRKLLDVASHSALKDPVFDTFAREITSNLAVMQERKIFPCNVSQPLDRACAQPVIEEASNRFIEAVRSCVVRIYPSKWWQQIPDLKRLSSDYWHRNGHEQLTQTDMGLMSDNLHKYVRGQWKDELDQDEGSNKLSKLNVFKELPAWEAFVGYRCQFAAAPEFVVSKFTVSHSDTSCASFDLGRFFTSIPLFVADLLMRHKPPKGFTQKWPLFRSSLYRPLCPGGNKKQGVECLGLSTLTERRRRHQACCSSLNRATVAEFWKNARIRQAGGQEEEGKRQEGGRQALVEVDGKNGKEAKEDAQSQVGGDVDNESGEDEEAVPQKPLRKSRRSSTLQAKPGDLKDKNTENTRPVKRRKKAGASRVQSRGLVDPCGFGDFFGGDMGPAFAIAHKVATLLWPVLSTFLAEVRANVEEQTWLSHVETILKESVVDKKVTDVVWSGCSSVGSNTDTAAQLVHSAGTGDENAFAERLAAWQIIVDTLHTQSQTTRLLCWLVRVFEYRDFYSSVVIKQDKSSSSSPAQWASLPLKKSLVVYVRVFLGDNTPPHKVEALRSRLAKAKTLSELGAKHPILFMLLSRVAPQHPSTVLRDWVATVDQTHNLVINLQLLMNTAEADDLREEGHYHEIPDWCTHLVDLTFDSTLEFCLKYTCAPLLPQHFNNQKVLLTQSLAINPSKDKLNCVRCALQGLRLVVEGKCAVAPPGLFVLLDICSNGIKNRHKLKDPEALKRGGLFADSCRLKKKERERLKWSKLFPTLKFVSDASISPGSLHATAGDWKFVNCKLSCLVTTALFGTHDDIKEKKGTGFIITEKGGPLLPTDSKGRGAALLVVVHDYANTTEDHHCLVLLTDHKTSSVALVDFQRSRSDRFTWGCRPILPPFEELGVFKGVKGSIWRDCFFLPVASPKAGVDFHTGLFETFFA